MSNVLFVGLDVDDNRFHGHLFEACGEEEYQFSCPAVFSNLLKKLKKFSDKGWSLRICYEASYIGFGLQRKLAEKGYECLITAPSLIPSQSGKKVKTDRLDARKLSLYFKKELLTFIHIPDFDDEVVRDLIRTRGHIVEQLKATKNHFVHLCKRMNINYRESIGKPSASLWTKQHKIWLFGVIDKLTSPVLQTNLRQLMSQVEYLESQVSFYDKQLEQIASKEKYQDQVQALCCFRGIKTLSALTLISEIGPIARFDHPYRLSSYAGMDVMEYSSGGRERKTSISKMGNKYIRTTVIEAAQYATNPPRTSRNLILRRQNASPQQIEIADRCMKRLYKKGMRLKARGKASNKIKVACAREMLGFIWESLKEVS